MPKYIIHLETIEHDETALPVGIDATDTKAEGDNPLSAARTSLRSHLESLDIWYAILALEKHDGPEFTFHVRDTGTTPMNVIARVLVTVEER